MNTKLEKPSVSSIIDEWKRDFRRTALQLSERISRTNDGSPEKDPIVILANAEILYQWLVAGDAQQKDFIEAFKRTGNIYFSS